MEVKTYDVYVQGRLFSLYEEQIRFDSPNELARHFDAPHPYFRNKPAPPMHLARDPTLFGIIVQYLSGYDILPLSEKGLPSGMSVETALKNLMKDAQKLRLNNLVKLLKKPTLPAKIDLRSWAGINTTLIPLQDLLDEEFEPQEGDLYWHSRNDILCGDGGAPVLILAKNVPVQLLISVDISPSNGWSRLEQSGKLSFIFHPQKSSFPPANGGVATQFLLSGVSTPDASVIVDSTHYTTADITTCWANSEGSLPLFTSIHPRTYLGEDVPDTKKLAIDLWAESLLFTVKRLSQERGDVQGVKTARRKLEINVFDARLLSRANLLGRLTLGS